MILGCEMNRRWLGWLCKKEVKWLHGIWKWVDIWLVLTKNKYMAGQSNLFEITKDKYLHKYEYMNK